MLDVAALFSMAITSHKASLLGKLFGVPRYVGEAQGKLLVLVRHTTFRLEHNGKCSWLFNPRYPVLIVNSPFKSTPCAAGEIVLLTNSWHHT